MKIRLAAEESACFIAGVEPARDTEGRAVPVQPGEVVDVDPELAKRLLEQKDKWQPVKGTDKKGDA